MASATCPPERGLRNPVRVDADHPKAHANSGLGIDTPFDRDLSCQHLHGSERRVVPLDLTDLSVDQAAASACVNSVGLLVYEARTVVLKPAGPANKFWVTRNLRLAYQTLRVASFGECDWCILNK